MCDHLVNRVFSKDELIGVSPEYENENDSYFVVRGGVETTVICDHMYNNSETSYISSILVLSSNYCMKQWHTTDGWISYKYAPKHILITFLIFSENYLL